MKLVILFLIGFFIVYIYNYLHCDKKVNYNYIPRTLEQDYNEPIMIELQYGKLYPFASPYIV